MKKNKIMIYVNNLEDKDFNQMLLNFLKHTKNEVDLYIESKTLIKNIPKKINVINLNIPNNYLKNIVAFIKKYIYILKSYKKYQFGIIIDNKSKLGNILIRNMCQNKTIYLLNDILYQESKHIRNYFTKSKIYDFNNIIFLNNQEKDMFLKYYPSLIKKTHVINYIVDCNNITEKSKEKIKESIKRTNLNLLIINELNEEKNKILSKIKMIENLNISNLKVYVIGDGIDKTAYESYIEDHQLETTIYLLGNKKNIYPYIKKCHYLLMNDTKLSKLMLEAIFLKTEIIAYENCSDDYFVTKENFGHVLSKDKNKLLDILTNKKKNNKKIDFQEINNKKLEKLESIITSK